MGVPGSSCSGLRFSLGDDAGERVKPFRSVWRFDGRIVYRRKVKQHDARTVITSVLTSAASVLTNGAIPSGDGRFDESTGNFEIIHLTSPSYACDVKLIEAD